MAIPEDSLLQTQRVRSLQAWLGAEAEKEQGREGSGLCRAQEPQALPEVNTES